MYKIHVCTELHLRVVKTISVVHGISNLALWYAYGIVPNRTFDI